MILCSACGTHNPDTRDRCFKCSTKLGAVLVPDGSSAADAEPEMRMEWFFRAKNNFTLFYDKVFDEEPNRSIAYRWPYAAIFWSFIPGGAQFYTGRYRIAAAFGAIQLALLVMVVVTFFDKYANWWLLAWHVFNMFAAAEAFHVVQQINGSQMILKYRALTFFSLLCTTGFILGTGQWVLWLFGFRFVAVLTPDLAPGFMNNDRVLVCNWPLWFGKLPQRGDIVYYTQEPLRAEIRFGEDSNLVSATPTRTFGVVNGISGDRISWKDGEPPQLNGVPFTRNLLPFNPKGLTRQFNMVVPEGRFVVLISTTVYEFSIGPSWGGTMPTPRGLESRGAIIKDFEATNLADFDKTYGTVILRYNPPQRRKWFGRASGIQETDFEITPGGLVPVGTKAP